MPVPRDSEPVSPARKAGAGGRSVREGTRCQVANRRFGLARFPARTTQETTQKITPAGGVSSRRMSVTDPVRG